jgi:hypothetical protein
MSPHPPSFIVWRLAWKLRRHFAVHRYLTKLPRKLVIDYGHGGPYTPKQVEATIRRNKRFSLAFLSYAQTLFCDADGLRKVWQDTSVAAEFTRIRDELAAVYFGRGGGMSFSYADVGRLAESHGGWGDGHVGGGGGDGGHGGHGGDGAHGGGDGGGH